jgi:dTDP-4-dehydrorhamnose reductase
MKLEAEDLVLKMSAKPLIFRLMTMYGWHSPNQRRNWVTWLLEKLQNGENVPVVDDVHNNYLWVGDASRCIRAALEREVKGIFHIGGPEVASRYEFSRQIADTFGLDSSLITPVSSEYFSGLAQRPSNSTCCIRKIQEQLGIMPLDLRAGLATMKAAQDRELTGLEVSAGR